MEVNAELPRISTPMTRPAINVHTWQRIGLVGILLLAVFLHFFRLEQEGYANLYYAAAVKSMLTSWRNFFFVSFDSGGFVTVDKPPLGLWVQAASAALFGFSGFSLLLPQALAGVLSVLVLYHLVQRVFGPTAGLLAALVLAVTPISVAANRNNTMDSQLVLVLLLAAWAAIRAVETGRLRWLLGCGLPVGLGFNVKMLQAFLVLPAFALLYLATAPVRWWKRLVHLSLAAIVLLVVSFAWVVAVDLTPPESRPYVGSSNDNTVIELIVGHNGLARLLPGGRNWLARLGLAQADDPQVVSPPPAGSLAQPGGGPGGPASGPPPRGGQPGQPQLPRPAGGVPVQGSGGGFSSEIGEPGLLRFFNYQLAGQISWLLPLALGGCLVAAWQTRPRFPLDRRHQDLLLWLAWLVPMVIFFSVANLFHRYYLEMLAPAIAALVGAGLVALWDDYKRPEWRGWLLPLALLGSAAVEAAILAEFPAWSRWLTPFVVGLCLPAAVALGAARLLRVRQPGVARPRVDARPWLKAVAGVGVLALLIPLAVWSFIPVWYGGHSGLPYAGPDLLEEPQRSGPPAIGGDDRLVDYLLANRGDATYLAATMNAQTAAPVILATGEPVMALGGFSGGDPILSREDLEGLVADGTVRFFLLSPQRDGQRDLTRWVAARCEVVPAREWRGAQSGPGEPLQLFSCW